MYEIYSLSDYNFGKKIKVINDDIVFIERNSDNADQLNLIKVNKEWFINTDNEVTNINDIYPNPFKDFIKIEMPNSESFYPIFITIHNLEGNIIHRCVYDEQQQLNTLHLSLVYILQ